MQRLQRFKGQIVVTVTVTSEVMGARKAGKCEAPTLRDEHTMQRIGGGQGLRVHGAAHTEHVWPGWERRATRSPEKNNPFFYLKAEPGRCRAYMNLKARARGEGGRV